MEDRKDIIVTCLFGRTCKAPREQPVLWTCYKCMLVCRKDKNLKSWGYDLPMVFHNDAEYLRWKIENM